MVNAGEVARSELIVEGESESGPVTAKNLQSVDKCIALAPLSWVETIGHIELLNLNYENIFIYSIYLFILSPVPYKSITPPPLVLEKLLVSFFFRFYLTLCLLWFIFWFLSWNWKLSDFIAAMSSYTVLVYSLSVNISTQNCGEIRGEY